ncbi:MAG: matrixin family metalloprotease [Myxococcales bacterium]|nr:matrixin family metalloprotease [Myxococcales bacterium]
MLWTAAVLVALSGAAMPSEAAAYCRLTTESPSPNELCSGEGTPLAWGERCISYSLVQRTQTEPPFEEVRAAADRAFGSWAAVGCEQGPIDLSLRQTDALSRCTVPEHNPRGGNIHSVIFLDDWEEQGLPGDAFGLTLIWHSPESGEIFDADMLLNETMGRFSVCAESCEPGQVDLENVITHEAGHFLGLGHSRLPSAAMYGESRVGEVSKRNLTDDDVAGICEVFGAAEGGGSCQTDDHAPRGGLATGCYEPDDGCAVGTPGDTGVGAGGSGALLILVALGLARRRRLRRGLA